MADGVRKRPALHEVLAVEGELEGEYKKVLDEALNTFLKKANLFMGSVRTFESSIEEEGVTYPTERIELNTTVKKKLDYIKRPIARFFDAVYQKEKTNQSAKADIVVGDVTLAQEVPATFLLGMETKLKKVREVCNSIPTLAPGISWIKDETQGKNIYRTEHPEEKFKTAKNFKSRVLYPATDQHPAQIKEWEESENVGKYIQHKWSGMITSAEKSELLGRVDKLIRAVKQARQRANREEVVNETIGIKLLDYIFNG